MNFFKKLKNIFQYFFNNVINITLYFKTNTELQIINNKKTNIQITVLLNLI